MSSKFQAAARGRVVRFSISLATPGVWMMRCTKMPGVVDRSRDRVSAGRHKVLDFGDGEARGGRHHRVEIARGLAENEIALGVALPGVHQRNIGEQAALHDVGCAVEFARFLAFRDDSANSSPRKEGGNAGAAGADTLGKRALRIEFEFKLTGKIKLLEELVFADIGRDHFFDLPGFEEKPKPRAINAGVIRDHRQIFGARVAQRLDQRLRDAAKSEPPGHQRHAILDRIPPRPIWRREIPCSWKTLRFAPLSPGRSPVAILLMRRPNIVEAKKGSSVFLQCKSLKKRRRRGPSHADFGIGWRKARRRRRA